MARPFCRFEDACHGFALKNKLFPEQDMVCVKTLYNYVDSALLKVRDIDVEFRLHIRIAHGREVLMNAITVF